MRLAAATLLACLLCSSALGAQASGDEADRGFDVVPSGEPDPETAPPAAQSTRFGTYHALLIAIEAYDAFPVLRTPVRDITRIRQTLVEKYGFAERTIQTLVNEHATQRAILRAIQGYRTLTGSDNLLIYYAGHGYLDDDTGEGFWIPSDAGRDSLDWISNEEIKKEIGFLQARHVLLVSDSCFSASLLRSAGEMRRTQSRIEKVADLVSRQAITSGGLEPVADGGHDGMSVFAYFFLRSLQSNDEPYCFSRDLFIAVDRMVSADTGSEQVPQFGVIPKTKDEFGEFIFENIGAVGGGAPPPEPTRIDDGIPVGWALPPGFEWDVRADGSFFYVNQREGGGEMVLVPAGSFRDARGEAVVIERPFLMDVDEVTVRRFQPFMDQNPRTNLRYWRQPGYERDDQPVVGVGLDVARAFASWARMGIPTEAEWECAAAFDPQLGRLRRYPWGDDFEAGSVVQDIRPPVVGSCTADVSPWGVRGMGSGIREWCRLPDDDPRRQKAGVIRGATQVGSGRRFRLDEPVSSRQEAEGTLAGPDIGFRCIVELVRS